MPSTTRFFCCWKARTAASVFGPKMPSTVTLCPRVRSRYCKLGTGCFWSPFFVSGQGLIVPETMSAPFTEARPESESVIAHVDTSDSRWASATARSRLTDTDQNGGSPLQASGFGGSGAFATGTSASETSDSETSGSGTSGIRYRIGSRSQRIPFGSIHSIAPSAPRRQDQVVSYTHLRAHETPEHLVCRLLLEKKKKKTEKNHITQTKLKQKKKRKITRTS